MKEKTETIKKAEKALSRIPLAEISEYGIHGTAWRKSVKFCIVNNTIYLQSSSLAWNMKANFWKNKIKRGEVEPTEAILLRGYDNWSVRWMVSAETVERYEDEFDLGNFFSIFRSDGTLKGLKKLIKENPSDYKNHTFSDEQIMKSHADYQEYLDLVAQDKKERKDKVVSIVPPQIDQMPFFAPNPALDNLTLNELVARIEAMGWEVVLKRKGDAESIVVNEERRRLLMTELNSTKLERRTLLRLEDLGITTLGQLVQMNKEQLLSAPSVKILDACLAERLLESYGLHFELDVNAFFTQQ